MRELNLNASLFSIIVVGYLLGLNFQHRKYFIMILEIIKQHFSFSLYYIFVQPRDDGGVACISSVTDTEKWILIFHFIYVTVTGIVNCIFVCFILYNDSVQPRDRNDDFAYVRLLKLKKVNPHFPFHFTLCFCTTTWP